MTALENDRVGALLDAARTRSVFRRRVDQEMVEVARQALGSLELPVRLADAGHPSGGLSDRTARLVALGGSSSASTARSTSIKSHAAGTVDNETRARSLADAMHALRRHILLEEAFLFPALSDAGFVAPVFGMLCEHGVMWQTMPAIERALAAEPAGSAAQALL